MDIGEGLSASIIRKEGGYVCTEYEHGTVKAPLIAVQGCVICCGLHSRRLRFQEDGSAGQCCWITSNGNGHSRGYLIVCSGGIISRTRLARV